MNTRPMIGAVASTQAEVNAGVVGAFVGGALALFLPHDHRIFKVLAAAAMGAGIASLFVAAKGS